MFANVLLHYYDATRLQASLASVKESYSIICITRSLVRKLQSVYSSMHNRMSSQVNMQNGSHGPTAYILTICQVQQSPLYPNDIVPAGHIIACHGRETAKALCFIWPSTGHFCCQHLVAIDMLDCITVLLRPHMSFRYSCAKTAAEQGYNNSHTVTRHGVPCLSLCGVQFSSPTS